jgi:hypothetical protein
MPFSRRCGSTNSVAPDKVAQCRGGHPDSLGFRPRTAAPRGGPGINFIPAFNVEAVASSCAAPLVAPPTTINGAATWMRVHTLGAVHNSPRGTISWSSSPSRGQGRWDHRVSEEVVTLRAGGSRVEVIVPDAASLAVLFPNLLDETRRSLCAEAGCAQGAAGAAARRDLLAAP